MPREPPLSRAFVSRNLLGVVVRDPGVPGRREGGWSFSAPIPREGPRSLNTSSRGSCRSYRERRCTWSPRRRLSQPALERGRGNRADSGAGECGRGGGGERGPARAGFVPGPSAPQRPPRGRLCVLFPLVPGAVTPISVRGDLREPGGEGRGRQCGERRGGARGAGRWKPRAPGAGVLASPPAAPFAYCPLLDPPPWSAVSAVGM